MIAPAWPIRRPWGRREACALHADIRFLWTMTVVKLRASRTIQALHDEHDRPAMNDTTGLSVPLARMTSAASSSAVPPISPNHYDALCLRVQQGHTPPLQGLHLCSFCILCPQQARSCFACRHAACATFGAFAARACFRSCACMQPPR